MSGQGMSEATMLASLRDIRLPAEAAGGLAGDIAVVICFAALAALCVGALVRLLSLRASKRVELSARDRMVALTDLPDPQKRVGLLHLLKELDPAGYGTVKGALYQPSGGIETATLEAEVARRV